MSTLLYPDVSNNNWSSTQDLFNFLSQLVPEQFAGVCHKMSEGNYYEDPYGAQCQTWCQQNNLPFIGFHYVTTDDPVSQAQTWRAAGGGNQVMMDWENNGGDLNNLWAVISAFNSAGVNVQLVYGPQWYWSQVGSGDLSHFSANGILLVSSAYPDGSGYASVVYQNCGGDSGEGWAPYGGATPSAWQFTDAANIAGINVDCNAYQGADIGVLFGTAPLPPPPPPPAPLPAPSASTYLGLLDDATIYSASDAILGQFNMGSGA
jgi:hypothetical protein